ncbi:MAG: phosphonate C-P lyase system protein PhnH [Bacteroidota bacterium]|nr:phosphonate C-P lyase system protein PhnH [uncultured Allomuricauda sp.]
MIRETNYDHLFESQKQYRLLLDCMAKPGVIANLDADINVPDGLNKTSALVGFALLNSDVSFCNTINQEVLDTYFIINTSASPAESDVADFIFVNGEKPDVKKVSMAKIGLPAYPESGAFIIIDVKQISDSPLQDGVKLMLEGPGVKDTKDIYVGGISTELLEVILERNIEYPLGVDTIITDKNGAVCCIPRSNKFKYQEL